MTLPFVDLVIKAKARFFPFAKSKRTAPPPLVRVAKPSDQRLSKTVMPSTGSRNLSDPFQPGMRSENPPNQNTPEPKIQRTISLQLSDVLDQLPSNTIKPVEEFDSARAIILKAWEVEKGMAQGKPSVPLVSIYQQAPEIFLNAVGPGDTTPVLLPYAKVLEQFHNFQVRDDQEHDDDLPQLDTPILQVTLEDTERFGTEIEPLQTSMQPPMKVEPAVARTIAEAEPEPVALQVAKLVPGPSTEVGKSPRRPKISLRDLQELNSTPVASHPAIPQTPRADVMPTPAGKKIPFHLPPNGTGASAAEKVPASSGPPVPTSELQLTPGGQTPATRSVAAPAKEPNEPAKLPDPSPLILKAPSNDIRPKFTLVPGTEPPPPGSMTAAAASGDRKIVLSLQAVLSELPAFQLDGSPMSVPENARVEFPLSMIEPQLASGRVSIPARVFERAVPEAYRSLFIVDPNETPITLPLQEIVKQLPAAALSVRADQEEVPVTQKFETPFSVKADEDAKRLSQENAERQIPATQCPIAEKPELPAVARDTPKNKEAGSPKAEALDAKRAIARASGMEGVAGCAISFTDGLSLAGNIPTDLALDGICSIGPAIMDKIDNHLEDTKLGGLVALTLYCGESTLTFFKQDKLCLTAWHKTGENLSAKTREQLVQLLRKVSQTYPELSHVDH